MELGEFFDELLVQWTDVQGHLATFVDLAEHASKIIELGTRGGVSTVAWLYGLEGHGHLWSVDIDPPPPMRFDHWTFIQGDDCSTEVLDQLPDEVDVVFIDTSHHYDHTRRELELYLPRVRSGGRIVLHDTEVEIPDAAPLADPPFPVKRAVTEFCDARGLVWTNYPYSYGLAVIEVP